MGYASKDIRNILVAGHAGSGKTTLTEALLYMSGATERMGRVEDGTTASDRMARTAATLTTTATKHPHERQENHWRCRPRRRTCPSAERTPPAQ